MAHKLRFTLRLRPSQGPDEDEGKSESSSDASSDCELASHKEILVPSMKMLLEEQAKADTPVLTMNAEESIDLIFFGDTVSTRVWFAIATHDGGYDWYLKTVIASAIRHPSQIDQHLSSWYASDHEEFYLFSILPQVMLAIGGQAPKAIRNVECFDFKEERWFQVPLTSVVWAFIKD